MNILNKISIKNLKLNKKRTISTIIGIILSVALICATSTLGTSFHKTIVENEINKNGYYHLKLMDIEQKDIDNLENNRDIKNIYTVSQEGYSILEEPINEYKPYLKLYSMSQESFEQLKFKLVKGRFATNNNEIVISDHINTNDGKNYDIGDNIVLEVGQRKSLDNYELYSFNPYEKGKEKLVNTQTREFKIVGIIQRPTYSFENLSDPGYTTITTGDPDVKIDAYIALSNPREYETSIPEILGAENIEQIEENQIQTRYDEFSLNQELLRWEAFAFSDSTINMLYSIISVVLVVIVFASVFCIRNSFAISTTEKIKMYGMLSSVGCTKKQIKRSVIFEAFLLGIIGIPLGILSGIFAVWILIFIVNKLLNGYLFNYLDGIVLNISIVPIVISTILGFLTIYLSAISSAKKASRVSPFEQLRNTQDIKINAKKLKTPKIISRIFHIGGELAYKNLKRSKKKYRTTVISLVVSIGIFITMNALITDTIGLAGSYYDNYKYNIKVSANINKTISEENLSKIISCNNIKYSYVLYSDQKQYIKITDKSKIKNLNFIQTDTVNNLDVQNLSIEENSQTKIEEEYIGLQIVALDSKSFEEYARDVGVNYQKDKAVGILCDTYENYDSIEDKTIKERVYKYNKNDTIIGEYAGKEVKIKIGGITDIHPYGYEQYNYHGGFLIVDYEKHLEFDFNISCITIESTAPHKLEKEIEDLKLDVSVRNLDEEVQEDKAMNLIIKIFLYGFIAVIILIGVTNIFNTITSNMELRQREFAMLKSIGMTKKDFNRMINLETIFYGTKSLIYGIILGLIGTFALYKAFNVKIDIDMYIPINAILLSIIFVFILIFIIMRYSLAKISKQNTMETIRKENI